MFVLAVCRCTNIQYVPFREHPKGPYYIPEFHPDTFMSLEVPDEGSIYYEEYEASLRRAVVADRKEDEEREKVVKGKHHEGELGDKEWKPAEEGDLDLSSLIDDNDVGAAPGEKKYSEGSNSSIESASPGSKRSRGSGEVPAANSKGRLFTPRQPQYFPSRKKEPDLYKSIAIDLFGFFVVCLIFYCICVPSRSLKTQ